MIKQTLLRGAWLMLGAAIAVALGLVAAFTFSWGSNLLMAVVAVAAIPLGAVLLGLLPGIRELEVTAARALLGLDGELVVPDRPTPAHRIRLCAWTVFHAVAGLVTGFLVLGLIPGAVMITFHGITGGPADLDDLAVSSLPGPVQAIIGIALLAVVLVGTWALGLLSVKLAPLALGPTSADRLLLAEARLAKESQQVALARELHDGIGHALSVISIQAAGGRRMISKRPDRAEQALDNIERAAAGAQAELDQVLGLLRNPHRARNSEPDLGQLGELVETHRRLGQRISLDLAAEPEGLPALVSRTGYRVLAEGLGNAHAHGAEGQIDVRVADAEQLLTITVSSPYRRKSRSRTTGGRGLAGLTERVRVLGGTVDAGPHLDRWLLEASIPHGRTK